jgi:NAD-dependent dihydropyrimidine dehydrogenase PreA subunit
MCEFCTKHGEGRKWYLEMKNYSAELAGARLTGRELKLAGVNTRAEWARRFMLSFVVPAAGGPPSEEDWGPTKPEAEPSTLEDWKTVHFGQLLPMKDVEAVLNLGTSITRIPCGCRYTLTGKTDARYCFGLGMDQWGVMGKYPDSSKSLEVMDRDQALSIIRKFDQEGLVHSGQPTFFRAEYVCDIDPQLCTGCKSCMSQCQFGAQFYSHMSAKVHIDPTRCFGCGVCMAACPAGAIKLLPRAVHPNARDLWLQTP